MLDLLKQARDWLREPAIKDADALDGFTTEAAARLAHRATVGYSQVKAGIHRRALWQDDAFVTRLEQCRWVAFAAVFADFMLILEGFLRPEDVDRQAALRVWLERTYADRLAPGPLHGEAGAGAAAVHRSFAERLAATAAAPPRDLSSYGPATAQVVFKHLPFHRDVVARDYPVIESMIRFGTVGYWDRATKRVAREDVMASLGPETL
jgi:hypothetical protein